MRFVGLGVLLVTAPLASADVVDRYLQAEMKKQNIPGLVLLVKRDGKVVRKQAFGFSDLELKVKAKPENKFELGSITKQFTGFALALLVDQGKLSLEDPVGKWLPEVPDAWKAITLRQLVFQISGLPEYALVPKVGLADTFTKDEWFAAMKDIPLDFPTGSAWAYSNTNFALLGWVIEKASGKPYAEFVKANILSPLDMKDTLYPEPYAVIPNRAKGYIALGGPFRRAEQGGISIQSDGSLISTVGDLAKWDQALSDGWGLKPETYRTLWSPATLASGRTRPYGMGWFLSRLGEPNYVGHGGASVGYSGGISRYLDSKTTVIILCNFYTSIEPMSKRVAELIDPSTVAKIPLESPADPNPTRTARIRQVIASLAEGKTDEAMLESDVIGPMKTSRARMGGAGPWATVRDAESWTLSKAAPTPGAETVT